MFETLTLCEIPEADEALRASVKALIAQALGERPLERRARSWMGYDRGFSRALGAAGLIGLTLPRQYGGAGRGPFARFVAVEELLAAGAPVAAHWIADRQSAPLILRYGTEEQRRHYLPLICRGEICFSIGMSEPGAGSDLAAVRTRAVRTEGGWRLTGSKIWTTYAQHNDYLIALVRTSEGASDRHEGLSQVIVDLHLPGVRVRPIGDLAGEADFCEVFFDEVELGEHVLIGGEGEGWRQVTAELAFERSGPERIYSSISLLDGWLGHLRSVGRVRGSSAETAGRLMAQLATLRELSIAVTARLEQGASPALEASLVKDLGTSFEQSIPALVADDLGAHPDEPVDPQLHRALLYVSAIAPSFSLRGGTREILRGIIARGMGLG